MKNKKLTILIPLAIYYLLYLCTIFCARSGVVLTIGEGKLPLSAFAGVFSAVSNICLIILVLYYKKLGFLISMLIFLIHLPKLIIWVFVQHNISSITGIFTDLFTILMLVIIMAYHAKVDRERERLQNLFEQTATALVNAIDTKDRYTHGHSARVADYSRKLAELASKSKEECDEVFYAALLHDVGKIGVPSSIINKAGKLTAEEYEVVKAHPQMGAQILEKISEYPFLSTGAHYHHERYDGSGYPEGLAGEEIPEAARIIAVADAYDAMTSIRSYRDPISQDKVREEIVKGVGTQFDPVYARLMLKLVDVDTEYSMKENVKKDSENDGEDFVVGEYRSAVTTGALITSYMTTFSMTIGSDDEATGVVPTPSMILFDALDGVVHFDPKGIEDRMYFEYGEIMFDGSTKTGGARKIQTKTIEEGAPDIDLNGRYRIEALRIDDHALIRILSKNRIFEVTVALPDSSRYFYIGFTGEHCCYSDMNAIKAQKESPADRIARIAEKISYIDAPAGDIPNVQIDGYRTDASEGIEIKDGLQISFHTKSLPTARLVWHCPFIDIYCADDKKVKGKNYRDLAFMRLDGESWDCDLGCTLKLNVSRNDNFKGWDEWKEFNLKGYDVTVTFGVRANNITVTTENSGIVIMNTVKMTGIDKPIYAAITGDQVAITGIKINKI